MKSLRDLAARAVITQRRFRRVHGRLQHEFALKQAQRAQYEFFCTFSKQSDAEAVLRVHNEARAELLDELERAIEQEADEAYGALGDGLGVAIEILRRHRGKT